MIWYKLIYSRDFRVIISANEVYTLYQHFKMVSYVYYMLKFTRTGSKFFSHIMKIEYFHSSLLQ